ncbi:MAG TPA: ABC transporter ATP-binding protein [Chthoniobacterales bacterium]|nr:ABC transporter ATP-binding protein [Chthoniobacterales bacterium]
MAGIILKNLSVARTSLAPESGLHLEIGDREFVVLTGPRGSGISTILRMIAGLEPSQGETLVDGRPLNGIPPKDRDVALVSKDYAPYPRMSVFDNLALGLRRRKFSAAEIKKRILDVAEILGLQALLDRDADSLGQEERQRVALARAMVLQPKTFLFDEPFSSLGTEVRLRGRAEIKRLHQRLPATIVYATHDPVDAMAMGSRTVVINRGMVQQDGSAESIYEQPANLFVAGFVGNPPMNLVHGTLKQDRDSLLFSEAGDGTIEVRLPGSRFPEARDFAGKPIVLGVRPEDLELCALAAGTGPVERASTRFRALVDRVEPGGAETTLHLQTGAHGLVCRTRRGMERREGGFRAQFEIKVEKTHLFDAESGGRIMQET